MRRFILDLGSVEKGTEYSIPDSPLLHSLDPARAPFDPKGANFRPEGYLSPASASVFLEPLLVTNATNLCRPLVQNARSMEICSPPPPCDGSAVQGVEVELPSVEDELHPNEVPFL